MITYILQNYFADELPARQIYLLHTFHLYFLEMERTSSYIELRSFPFKKPEISILYGHFPWVCEYLLNHGEELQDTVKILHTCWPDELVSLLGLEKVYSCKVDRNGEAIRYDGETYGLPFDVTASELDALNTAHLPLEEQVAFAYEKVS